MCKSQVFDFFAFSDPPNWILGLFYFGGLIIFFAVKQSCDVLKMFDPNICFDMFKLYQYVVNMWCCYFPLYVIYKVQDCFFFSFKFLAFSPCYLDVLVIASVSCIWQHEAIVYQIKT